MKGERDLERRSPEGWHHGQQPARDDGRATVQVGPYRPRQGAKKKGWFYQFDQRGDGDLLPFSYIDHEAWDSQFHVHAFHAFPAEHHREKRKRLQTADLGPRIAGCTCIPSAAIHLPPTAISYYCPGQQASPRLVHSELLEAWPVLSDEDRREGFLCSRGSRPGRCFMRWIHATRPTFRGAQSSRAANLAAHSPGRHGDVIQGHPADQRRCTAGVPRRPDPHGGRRPAGVFEDAAGGLMNPLSARLRPDAGAMGRSATCGVKRANGSSIYYAYVLDAQRHLLGVVSLRRQP